MSDSTLISFDECCVNCPYYRETVDDGVSLLCRYFSKTEGDAFSSISEGLEMEKH